MSDERLTLTEVEQELDVVEKSVCMSVRKNGHPTLAAVRQRRIRRVDLDCRRQSQTRHEDCQSVEGAP